MTDHECGCSTFGPGPHDADLRHPNPKACEHAEYGLDVETLGETDRLHRVRLVRDHMMRAGFTRSERIAYFEAERIVRTVESGLRWDLDDDQLREEHRAFLAARAELDSIVDPSL